MELIKAVGLMKNVTALPQCYEGLVKEFIVNIPDESYGKSSREVCKVVVRGKCVNLSPIIINRFLERGTNEGVYLEATNNEICRMITAGQVNEWPSRKHLAASKLTVKHASTNAIKLPIAFPSIICGIILSQQLGTLRTSDIPSRRKTPLSIHYKLFEESHVNDVMTSARRESASKGSLIDQLKETCKELDNGIKVAKARKEALEVLICSLEREGREKAGKESNTRSQSYSGSSEDSEGVAEDEDEVLMMPVS
ncbi:uncharacterized protein LOC127078454 [Lathyrus oleraceus]|uniref:uncharacterized protein LOC127078454 n=1 Tax=Pisum sativum TaxID=3888 RepID=UPI0021D1B998|nr:uncharacterized protein LOC127078454 [Pisum sativum]